MTFPKEDRILPGAAFVSDSTFGDKEQLRELITYRVKFWLHCTYYLYELGQVP
jgi:hypothetical protein